MESNHALLDFRDKTVVVTGAGAGIGRGVAQLFAEHNAEVVGLDINFQTLQQTSCLIRSSGGRFQAVQADVSSEQSVEEGFRVIAESFPAIDILVNNAGAEFYADFVDVDVPAWHRQLAVNLDSVFLCCRKAVLWMIEAGGGCIVNTASVQALATTGQTAPYAAAKAGILGMTRDLGKYNIRVNSICPGCIQTPMMGRTLARDSNVEEARRKMESAIPLRRLGTPRDIAGVVMLLASDYASYVSGVTLPIDGGLLTRLCVA